MSEQLSSLDRPVIRVAICGEVRAGKSALLNAVLRDQILSDNLGNDDRPMVFAAYEGTSSVQYLDVDGIPCDAPDNLDDETMTRVVSIQVGHDREDLAPFEFVELPLTTAEELDDHHRALIRSSDIMIWVTIASQAWRLTEKTIVDELRDRRPKRAILAVSRGDKLRRDADRDKIMSRMERETRGSYFDEIVMVTNSKARIDETKGSDTSWGETGAGKIVAWLNEMSEEIYEEMAAAKAAAQAGDVVEKAKDVSPEPVEDTVKEAIEVEDVVEAAPEPKPEPVVEAVAEPVVEPVPERETPVSEVPQDAIVAATADLISTIGAHSLVGFYSPEAPKDCVVLKGETQACETVGETFGALASTWLTTYGAEDVSDFGMVVHTTTQSVHFRKEAEKPTVFLMAPVSEVPRGAAQIRHEQICDAIASLS